MLGWLLSVTRDGLSKAPLAVHSPTEQGDIITDVSYVHYASPSHHTLPQNHLASSLASKNEASNLNPPSAKRAESTNKAEDLSIFPFWMIDACFPSSRSLVVNEYL
jgi:hypothetical protein